jgi:phosphoribosylglycinamide formyltransferase-1
MNFAVLVSGNGSNLQAIIKAVKAKAIKANLAVVISDKKDAFALERARDAGIEAVFINPKDYAGREAFDVAVIEKLKEFSIDFVVLAGFMRILSPVFIKAFPNKILNIHPALLPAFKGAHAIRDAFDSGVKVTGVTVHFVDEEVDHGAIILQEAVEIEPGDTLELLEERIHKTEHKIYPQAIGLFAEGKIYISNRNVRVRSPKS